MVWCWVLLISFGIRIMSTSTMSRNSEWTERQQDVFKNMWMDIYEILMDRLPIKKMYCIIEISVIYWYLPLCSSLTTLQGGLWRQTAGSQQNLSCLDVIHVSVMCKNLLEIVSLSGTRLYLLTKTHSEICLPRFNSAVMRNKLYILLCINRSINGVDLDLDLLHPQFFKMLS